MTVLLSFNFGRVFDKFCTFRHESEAFEQDFFARTHGSVYLHSPEPFLSPQELLGAGSETAK